jgi:hypothetical protein
MADITIKMKDGTVREFPHKPRAGGSYTKTIKYEGAFAVVTDEYYQQTAIPAADIAEVKVIPDRY